MGFGNLRGMVPGILRDQRTVVNPFGFRDSHGRPLRAIIRRGLDPNWTEYLTSILTAGQEGREKRKARLVSQLKAGTGGGRGFRRSSAASGEDRILRDIAEDFLAQSEDPARKRELERLRKEGVARYLFIGGDGLENEDGSPVDLDAEEERLKLLSVAFWDDEETQPAVNEAEFLWDWNETSATFLPRMNAGGEQERNPGYQRPLGDTIQAWIEDEADDLQAFYDRNAETLTGNS